jgi:hypothetical protein
VVSPLHAGNPKVFRHGKKSHIGIDLWHAVEFSRYGCALLLKISLHFQGRPTNLVQGHLCGQTRAEPLTSNLKEVLAVRP